MNSDDMSEGELLASFGGDVDAYTDYHCGAIDSDGEPIEHEDYEDDGEEDK
jgi:hypothetical protein